MWAKHSEVGGFLIVLPYWGFSRGRWGHKQLGKHPTVLWLGQKCLKETPAHRNSNYSAIPWPKETLCTITHQLLPSDICLNFSFSGLTNIPQFHRETDIYGTDKDFNELTHSNQPCRFSQETKCLIQRSVFTLFTHRGSQISVFIFSLFEAILKRLQHSYQWHQVI